ncbi:TolC family outer membrane protein [soil metagenome]
MKHFLAITCLFIALPASAGTVITNAITNAITWTDAVQRAERENPEIAAAREGLRAAEAAKTGSYSGFLPSVRASVGYENTERSGSSLVATTTGTGWTAGINGSWNLFSGFADTARVSQAEANKRAADAALILASAKISNDLKSAFEAVAYSRDYAKLTQQILKRREENLRLVQLRFESGRENKGSALLSEAYLEQARFDDMQARNAARTSAVALAKVLAMDGDGTAEITVVGNVPVSEPSAAPDFTSLVMMTPDYLQSLEQAKALQNARKIAASSFYPSLDLTTSLGKRGDDFFPNDNTTKTVGVTLSIPIFSGGRDYTTYRTAVANAAAGDYTRDNSVRDIRRRIELAWAGYIESVAKLRSDESFRKAAIARSEIGRTKYNNGLLTFDDWDIIENDLINREKTVLQTRRDRATAEGAWEQVQGKGVWR